MCCSEAERKGAAANSCCYCCNHAAINTSSNLLCMCPFPPCPTDWQLTLRRVVLLNVELRDPPGASSSSRNRTSSRGPSGPLLWPLNAFGSVGTDLVLQDVRMVINNPAQFRLFLDLLSAQPALQSSVNTTLHTVRSWLAWAVLVVTAGPCWAYQMAVGVQNRHIVSQFCFCRREPALHAASDTLACRLSLTTSTQHHHHSTSGSLLCRAHEQLRAGIDVYAVCPQLWMHPTGWPFIRPCHELVVRQHRPAVSDADDRAMCYTV